ncbi:hypothetical protein KEM55_000567 [Ascosphaera atra]|nr:hypothetical protein KEM55_000567 [Ascosphaera atra]
MRDVSTQFSEAMSYRPSADEKYNSVETHTPSFIRRQTFKVNPNPKYVSHVDPDGSLQASNAVSPRAPPPRASFNGSAMKSTTSTPFRDPYTPSRTNFSTPSRPQGALFRQPRMRTSAATSTGDGGSLGAYTHANSPVKKGTATPFEQRFAELRNSSSQTPARGSPLKRQTLPPGTSPANVPQSSRHNQFRDTSQKF